MSFQTWSVVYGEQPSASKWNILGTNDQSFNDGSGLAFTTNNVVPANALATNAITLGYAQITAGAISTSNAGSAVSGLTTTVIIPSGGRKVKITAYTYQLRNNTAGNQSSIQIWDGTVGSGTLLSQAQTISAYADIGNAETVIWVGTPSAGSKTYNVGLSNLSGSNTAKLDATSTAPAFILVEAI
jgi:hypothetical protein